MIKINFDDSLKVADRRGGIRIIVKNNKGEIVGAVHAFIEGTTNPMAIEANVAFRALLFGKDMRFTRIILEGDALSVITKMMQTEPSLSDVGNLGKVVKDLMKSFSWSKIQYVRRETNEVAHCLAKNALSLKNDVYWVDDCPEFLFLVLAKDCN